MILHDVRTLDRKVADLNARIEAEVEASGSTLTEIFGVGPSHPGRYDHWGSRQRGALPDQGPLRLLLRYNAV